MKKNLLLTCVFFLIFIITLVGCSEPIEELPPLTEIPFEGNIEAAYEAICNFDLLRLTDNTNTEYSIYRPYKITFDDLIPEYYLRLAYHILPEREREIIVEDAGRYSKHGYLPKKDEFITEDIEYTVYTVEELEEAVKKLFGENVNVNHKNFGSSDPLPRQLVYDEKKYLSYYTGSGGEFFYCDFSVVLYAETDGEFVYVTDKFLSFDYGANEDGCTVVIAIYGDGGHTDLICDGKDVPAPFGMTPAYDTINHNVMDLFSDEFSGLSDWSDYMQTYRHTFKLAEDGTYFWVSSEPIEE